MKFFASTLLAVLSVATKRAMATNNNEQRNLATLAEKWSIQDPQVDQQGLSFDFVYDVSNFIDEGQAYYEVYTEGCAESGEEVTSGITESPLVDVPVGSVTDDAAFDVAGKQATAPIAIDVATIADATQIYAEAGEGDDFGATIKFCVRFGLKTLGDPATEVNFLESVVTMNVDLGDGFTVADINVTPKEQLLNTASQSYTVEGFLCNPDTGDETPQASAFNQGSLISVCIKPDAAGIADGIKMRTVDDFTWTRDTTTQPAVENGAAASNSLTSFDAATCGGGDYCTFSTILFAAFYSSNGQVGGSGTSTMQFGTARRRLQEEEQGRRQVRSLQQEPEAAATSAVSLDVDVQVVDEDDGPSLQTAAGSSVGTAIAATLAVVGVAALI